MNSIRRHLEETGGKRCVVNSMLTGVQQRSLEDELGLPTLDRIGLIISIFAQRAHTKEARLQVELARLNYEASRLVRIRSKTGGLLGFGAGGSTLVVSARERGGLGAIGGEAYPCGSWQRAASHPGFFAPIHRRGREGDRAAAPADS